MRPSLDGTGRAGRFANLLPAARVWSLMGLLLATAGSAIGGAVTGIATRGCVDDVPWTRVASGIWAWAPSAPAEIGPENGGHVAVTTAIVHGRQALLIDPGPSRAHGDRVRRSLVCRFGATVRWIVNTHAHAENVLGNAAFADRRAARRPPILASAGTREAMARRCLVCLASLSGRLGPEAMQGTRIVLPTRTLAEGDVLRLGPHRLRVLRIEQGHTEADLVLWDPQERLLWLGGLAYAGRVPELAQGRIDAWIEALDRLAALAPRVVLGPALSRSEPPTGALPPALTDTRAYLSDLRTAVFEAMDAGLQAHEAATLELPAYRAWPGYAERHGFNAQRAWRELEPAWMDRAPAR